MSRACSKCKQVKDLCDFNRRLGGHAYVCRSCISSYNKQLRSSRTPEQIELERVRSENSYKENRDDRLLGMKVNHLLNRDERISKQRKWYSENRQWVKDRRDKAADSERSMRRYAAKIGATPRWADSSKIMEVYEFAAQARSMGLDVQVDHIVPLISDIVCGLHVHQNLRPCLSFSNRSKGNRYWPDMPENQTTKTEKGD